LRITGLNILVTLILLIIITPSIYIYFHQKSLKNSLMKPLGPDAHAFFQIDMAPQLSEPERPDTIRVLTLGGSTTYGTRLERNQTYPAVLEKLLNDRYPDTHFEVFNAGVPWHTSMHSLLRYVALYATWKPDVVIVMHAFNDIFQTSEGKLTSGSFRGDYGHFFGALGQRVNPKDEFADDVHRWVVNNWFARTWYSDFFPRKAAPQKNQVDLYRALPHFHRNLHELIKRAQDDGAQVVLLTQPSLYRDKLSQEERETLFYDYYYRDYALIPTIQEQSSAMDAFNQITRETAKSGGVHLVDLEQDIPKNPEYMYDDVHYTIRGAEQVARKVFAGLPWKESSFVIRQSCSGRRSVWGLLNGPPSDVYGLHLIYAKNHE
jgi:lysophospholipase L1-like esterase